jgi:hypothetical protein
MFSLGERLLYYKSMNLNLKIFLITYIVISTSIIITNNTTALKYSTNSNLSNSDASFLGEFSGDTSGVSISGAGDVNGDGFDDFLITAHANDEGGKDAGQTYLIFGKSTGWTMDVNLNNSNASFIGEESGDHSGTSTTGVGDVNGDGFDDFMIGAYWWGPGSNKYGKAYLFFGRNNNWSMDTNLSKSNASFIGEQHMDYLGLRMAGGGDINGDGFDDIIMRTGVKNQVHLVFGKQTGWSNNVKISKARNVTFNGTYIFGYSLAINGDINGDNLDDILIGNYIENSVAGKTYLFFGRNNWNLYYDSSKSNASFIGEFSNDFSSSRISVAGDVNDDGYDDFLIGASSNDGGGNDSGKTYLIFGRSSNWSNNNNLSNANASFLGENPGDASGSVAGVGDVNGDGFDDFIIGAIYNNGSGNKSGKAYLILGKKSGWKKNISLKNSSISFIGEDSWDLAGGSVSGAGDANGDGYDDILIGAYGDEEGTGSGNTGQTYLIFPDQNSKPINITSVKAYFSSKYITEISEANLTDTIYIELNGTDGNSSRKDIALVNVASNYSYPNGFRLRLIESGLNTGIYHGNFTFKDRTHKKYNWLKTSNGEIVTITSIQDIQKNTTVLVNNSFKIYPLIDNLEAKEDFVYKQQYYTLGWKNITWIVKTNASWLKWNESCHKISGIPKNNDIGQYWVLINISRNSNQFDERNFTLTVINQPPIILTKNNETSIENQTYEVDYNSDDDGQGTITWKLITNATWLTINNITGLLTGKPLKSHIGEYWVNISVFDGNGGSHFTNFTLKVFEANVPPVIDTMDKTSIDEDQYYEMIYTANDKNGHKIFWNYSSNASWLKWGSANHTLFGTPGNLDVGKFWVCLNASDGFGGYDEHNFTLTVYNINDPPKISTTDITIIYEDEYYEVEYFAIEVDQGDSLTWTYDSNATWLYWGQVNHTLFGIARNEDVGSYWVRINISDNKGGYDEHYFTLTVINTNDKPIINTVDITNVNEDEKYMVIYTATDVDIFDSLNWNYNSNANWLNWGVLNHTLYGTPLNEDVGSYWVRINISDGNEGYDEHYFTLNVINTNDRPIIDTVDVTTIHEDEYYEVLYTAIEVDSNDEISWSFETNATWLNWGPTNHSLFGLPNNDDVGSYWVHIKTFDKYGGFDEHYFTITVQNVNDAPSIIGAPNELEISAYERYILDMESYIEDVDNDVSDLKLQINSEYAIIEGLSIIFNYTNSVITEEVRITVSDNKDMSLPHLIVIKVIPKDIVHPWVESNTPVGEDVSTITKITIVFSEPMDKFSSESAFSILPKIGGRLSWIDNKMIFNPKIELEYNTTYTITIKTTCTDIAGNPLKDSYTWNFTTVKLDTDNDNIPDSIDSDDDGDGYADIEEMKAGTDPLDKKDFPLPQIIDTDGDNLPDEVDPDDDNDGSSDKDEIKEGTDPLLWDTDGDGYSDSDDHYPLDNSKWKEELSDKKEKGDDLTWLWIIIVIITIIVISLLFLFRKKLVDLVKKEEKEEIKTEQNENLPIPQFPQYKSQIQKPPQFQQIQLRDQPNICLQCNSILVDPNRCPYCGWIRQF